MRSRANFATLIALGTMLAPAARAADTLLLVSDAAGDIGQVDLTTQSLVGGSVRATGQALTDVAEASGTLYGVTATSLYTVDPTTGAATLVGALNTGLGFTNALTTGGGGLLSASFVTKTISFFAPGAPGAGTSYATSPLSSAGALATTGATLYESGVDRRVDALVNVTAGTYADFHVGSTTGATLGDVYALADDGVTLYAVAGTEVYSVNTANAVLTPLFSYSGAGLGSATGAAVLPAASAAVPEPGSLAVLGLAALGLGAAYKRRAG